MLKPGNATQAAKATQNQDGQVIRQDFWVSARAGGEEMQGGPGVLHAAGEKQAQTAVGREKPRRRTQAGSRLTAAERGCPEAAKAPGTEGAVGCVRSALM